MLPVLAAAAAVLAVVAGASWLGNHGSRPGTAASPQAQSPEYVVLAGEGWTLDRARVTDQGADLAYGRPDGAEVEINWRPSDQYAGYLADRQGIGASEGIELLGAPAQVWAYDGDDHAALREAVGGHLIEVRGRGLSRTAYDEMLAGLRPLAADQVRATFPAAAFTGDGFVRPGAEGNGLPPAPERPALIRAPGWSMGLDQDVFWERGHARIVMATVGNVPDPFAYDRYRDAEVRKSVRVLGRRALLAEWDEGSVHYRVVALSATPTTVLIFEGTGSTRNDFLEAVRSAQWVSQDDYRAAIAGG